MSKWERLVIYPLLFAVLFLNMSNNEKILEATESIADEIRVRRVVIGSTSLKAGSIYIDSPLGFPNRTFRWP
jgi:hypothetical protein